MPKGKWKDLTPADERKIEREYLDKPVKTLASEIGITGARVLRYLDKKGLSIPRELVKKRQAESRFKKGDIPINKGKKQSEYMTPETIERTKATRFKKGNVPHNTYSRNGVIVERKDTTGRLYKYIRVAKGKWELLHRVIWQEAHGPIPSDHVVVFIDGNSTNTTIDNLELISMQENMLRNSYLNIPQEIIPTMIINKQLETKIKKLQNG